MDPVRDRLGEVLRRLYERAEVKLVTTYFPGLSSWTDFGVSASLHNGAVVDFWIDLSDERTAWRIEYSVQRGDPDKDGSHTEMNFPAKLIDSASDLPKAILAAIDELRQAVGNDVLFR